MKAYQFTTHSAPSCHLNFQFDTNNLPYNKFNHLYVLWKEEFFVWKIKWQLGNLEYVFYYNQAITMYMHLLLSSMCHTSTFMSS